MSLCLGDIALLTGKTRLPLPTSFGLTEDQAAQLTRSAHYADIRMANGDDQALMIDPVDLRLAAPLYSHYGTFVGDQESEKDVAQVVFVAPCSIIVVSLPAGLVEVHPRASVQSVLDELECKIPATDVSYVDRAQDFLGFAMKQLRSAFAGHGSVSSERGHTSR